MNAGLKEIFQVISPASYYYKQPYYFMPFKNLAHTVLSLMRIFPLLA